MFLVCRKISLFCFTLLILLGVDFKQVSAQEKKAWIRASSENFVVNSALSEKKTIELLKQLEMFRVAVLLLTSAKDSAGSVPTEIYVMSSTKDYLNIGAPLKTAGVFISGMRNNLILMKEVRGVSETHIIQHEYVHYIMDKQGSLNYPRWFREGFAEYLGSAEMERGRFKVGTFPEHRENSLRYFDWVSIKKILDPESVKFWTNEMRSMFYTQSWAIVHYLQSDPEKRIKFNQNMIDYIALKEAGADGIQAFEKAFDVDVESFGLAVKKYLEIKRFRYFSSDPKDLLPKFDPTVVKLSIEEISLGLAKVALQRGKLDNAQRWFNISLKDERFRGTAEAGLGDVFKFRGEFEEALPHFEKAISLAPTDPLVHLDMAEYWHSLAESDEEDFDRDHLKTARIHYLNAWKLDKTLPEIYAMYGRSFIHKGEDVAKGIEMLQEAQRYLASSLPIRLSLADAYLLAGQYENAIESAKSVIAWTHSKSGMDIRASEIVELAKNAMQETEREDL